MDVPWISVTFGPFQEFRVALTCLDAKFICIVALSLRSATIRRSVEEVDPSLWSKV